MIFVYNAEVGAARHVLETILGIDRELVSRRANKAKVIVCAEQADIAVVKKSWPKKSIVFMGHKCERPRGKRFHWLSPTNFAGLLELVGESV